MGSPNRACHPGDDTIEIAAGDRTEGHVSIRLSIVSDRDGMIQSGMEHGVVEKAMNAWMKFWKR